MDEEVRPAVGRGRRRQPGGRGATAALAGGVVSEEQGGEIDILFTCEALKP